MTLVAVLNIDFIHLYLCYTAGKRSDSCHPSPCQHGGSCIQISQPPGFRCRCEGTGYFGARCNRGMK
ncbi:egf-like domain [Holotrichia oblita]|uniref:Egf-like domain n=1 Tax=Holotrichia oblita TaxID=644536 RepID=A0ACB9TV85_HOLOL|nr:egf-like domain [Holotrichia oblita]